MLRDSIDMAFKQGQTLDTQRIHQDKLIKQGIQFPHGKMVNLVKKETITLGPSAMCARNDITLPGHKRPML